MSRVDQTVVRNDHLAIVLPESALVIAGGRELGRWRLQHADLRIRIVEGSVRLVQFCR